MSNSISSGAYLGGSALGVAGNILGSVLSNAQSYSQSKKLMVMQAKLNYLYGKRTALESPSWNRQGLEDAGYNPMLAVQNATSGVNSNFSGLNNSTASDYGNAISQGIANAQSFQRLENETKTAESTQDLNYAGADKAKAEKAEIVERLPFVSKQAKADYMKTEMETAQLENDIHYQNEFLNYLDNSLRVQERVARIHNSGVVYNADTLKDIADKHSPSGRSASFENYTRGIQNVLNGVGSIVHGYNETSDSRGSNESETVYYDKNGNVRGSVSHKGKSNSSSSKKHRKGR